MEELTCSFLEFGRTGHIGFNEPGSGEKSRTRLISLDHITIADAASDFFGDSTVSEGLHKELVEFLGKKRPGQVDAADVQNVKTLIRKAEAKAACRYIGLPDDRMHFLEMPFYQTGTVKKSRYRIKILRLLWI